MFYHWARRSIFGYQKGHILLLFFWISWEYIHMQWDLTWSWLNIGNVFASYPSWIQWYEYTGIFGGAIWILLINILIYYLLIHILNKADKKLITAKSLTIALLFIAPLFLSLYRYHNYEESGKKIHAVVVQPNIDPYKEQYVLSPEEVMERIFSLADIKTNDSTRLIVCPESAIQEDIWENQVEYSPSFQYIQQYLKSHPRASVIIGASTFYRFKEGDSISYSARFQESQQFWYDAYNTAIFTDTSGKYYTYHKSKLVVGVEKMPFPEYLYFLKDFALDLGGTIGTLGISKERYAFPVLPNQDKISTAICYESVYGEFVAGFVRKGAKAICIITNDGWWNDTPGHRQHLQFAALRAIETRRSIIRSANTGISCFVNQKGEILQATPYWKRAVINGDVGLNDKITFYVKNGDYLAKLSLYAVIVVVLLSLIQKFLQRKQRAHQEPHSSL